MEVNIHIGFWTLEMKCTQYGICGEVAFKNARAMVFWKSGGAGTSFQSGLENSGFFVGQLPLPIYASPERLIGSRILSSELTHMKNVMLKDLHFKYQNRHGMPKL